MTKLVSSAWKGLSAEDKAPYLAKAKEDKLRYKEEMERYVPPPDDGDDGDGPSSSSSKKKAKKKTKPTLDAEEVKEILDDDDQLASLLVPTEVFMKLLQDPGKINNNDPMKLRVHTDLKKLATAYWDKWKARGIPLKENKFREIQAILAKIILLRKYVDISAVNQSLHKYARTDIDEAQMFILGHNNDVGGQDFFVRNLLPRIIKKPEPKESNRDGSLAIRAAYVFLLQKFRGGILKFLSGKWIRADYDQSMSTSEAFGEEALEEFVDNALTIERPEVMDNDDVDPDGLINPDDCDYKTRSVHLCLLSRPGRILLNVCTLSGLPSGFARRTPSTSNPSTRRFSSNGTRKRV